MGTWMIIGIIVLLAGIMANVAIYFVNKNKPRGFSASETPGKNFYLTASAISAVGFLILISGAAISLVDFLLGQNG